MLFSRHKPDPFLNRLSTCVGKWIQYDNRKRSVVSGEGLDKDESPKTYPKAWYSSEEANAECLLV